MENNPREETMKILFVGDPHLDAVGSGSRVDDYGETCIRKIEFVLRVAESEQADLIVYAGDTNGEGVENRAFRVRMKTLLKSSRVPQMTLVGNHPGDTVRGKFQSWTARELGDYVVSGCFSAMVGKFALPEGGCFLGLNAYQYTPYTLPPDDPDHPVRVVFAHAFIDLPDPELSFTTSRLKDQYPKLEAIFAGHDHQHYASMKLHGVWVHRPGSLLRTSNDQSSQRIPCVGLYDSATGAYKEIEVIVALPTDKVFSQATKILKTEAALQLKSVTDTLSGLEKQKSSVRELVWGLTSELDPDSRQVVVEDLRTSGFTI
jgi:DNA repair exonuclease SbcCD nuclease subunit